MIYRWDDLYESQEFEHDQKFVKAEQWKEACDELEDKVKTITFKDQEITKLKKALEVANEAIIVSANQLEGIGLAFTTHGTNLNVKFMIENSYENARQAREAQKQIKEVLGG